MVSIVILTHDERRRLAAHLPALLSQQGVDYEVIVVDMHSKDGTDSLLQNLEETYPTLRHLSLPTNSRDISQEMLALHLGIRTAVSSQVLLLDADTQVPSEHWLADVLHLWHRDYDTILIPTVRERTKRWGDYFTAGHEAWHNTLLLRQATRHGLFRAGNAVVGISKDAFLHHQATAELLALKTGTLDIFVARTANRHKALCITDTALYPCKDANPRGYVWAQRRLYNVETSRHFPRRFLRRLTYIQHCLCTIHRGSLMYSLQDWYDKIRWRFTSKKAFIKKHY